MEGRTLLVLEHLLFLMLLPRCAAASPKARGFVECDILLLYLSLLMNLRRRAVDL